MPAGDSFSRLRTPVCDLLGCEYPILQAGMGGVARAELVSAVSVAGGYGFLGMVREPPQRIADEIRKVRAQSGKPFGVNIIPAATDAELLEQQVEVCLRERVHSVCLFWDVDAKLIDRLREAGILVLHQVGSVADADDAWRAGAQILIAQGREAGGHVRGDQSVLTLTPQIVDATPLPVVASGGIVDGRQMAATMMLGAQGVHCGTLFLATFESNAHDYHKRRIVQATSDDTIHTVLFRINWPENAPVRVIQNSVTRGERTDSPTVIGREGGRPIYLFSTDSPLRETDGDLEAMALYAGQGVSAINAIVPARQRIEDLLRQAAAAFNTREKSHHGSIGKIVTG